MVMGSEVIEFKTELCKLAYHYKTDKCPQIKHHFTEFYYEMFKDRRESVKKVIEIGIGKMEPYLMRGASLYMWREWFPNAMIYGADIDPELLFSDDRIQTFLVDQTHPDELEKMIRRTGSDIDLFVEDGSHIPDHQVRACLAAMPLLDNPTYVIEDVGDLDILNHLTGYECQVLRLSHRQYNDDRLVVVRKYKNK